jgi:hypothetical protein
MISPDSTPTSARLDRCRLGSRYRAWIVMLFVVAVASPLRAQIDYPDFTTVDGLRMVGSAVHRAPVARLTEVGRAQRGAIWFAEKIRLVDGFVSTFQFQFTQTGGRQDGSLANGGDGIAFVIQNGAADALGGSGADIGYSGIANACAIELDTYFNDDPTHRDGTPNHVSLQRGPNVTANHASTIDSTSRIPWLDDGGVHTVIIEYIDRNLRVYIDNCVTPAIDVAFDLAQNVRLDNGSAWVGLTSSTGDAWENHDILNWRLNPAVGAIRNGVLCLGDTVTLTAPGTYPAYQWSTGATSQSIRVVRGGTYWVRANDTLGCSARTVHSEWRLEEHELQRPQISSVDTLWLCDGETIRLDGGCCLGRRWSTGDTAREIDVRAAGLYWEDVVDAWGCRGRSDSVRVLIRPLPRPVITASGPTEFCRGDSVVLVATEHARYRWSTGDTTRSIVVRESGQYSVEVVDSNGCRAASTTLVVMATVRPTPVIAFRGPSALCAGAETTLDAGAGFARYRWSTGDTTRTIVVRAAGSYDVTVTTDRGCIGSSSSVVVRVSPLPTPAIVVDGRVPLCPGSTATLRADGAYAQYRWSTGDTTATITVDAQGEYSLTVIDSNGCEGNAPPVRVEVAPGARATIVAGGPLRICDGDSVVLSTVAGMRSYEWSTGATTRSIVVRGSGRYALSVIDSNGCVARDTAVVEVLALPAPVASPDVAVCVGESTLLSVANATTVSWAPTDGLACASCPSTMAAPAQTTTYVVTAVGEGGCSATDSVTVIVTPAAAATLAVGDGGTIYPGRKASIPVYLLDDLEKASADELIVRVDYGSTIMRLESVRLEGPLTGWALDRLEEIPGRFTARLSAPDATTLRGTGHALDLEFQTFLGDTVASRIDVAMTLLRRPCASVTSRPGMLRLDSLCGMNSRMIEALAGSLDLRQNSPNPFNPSTEITFSLPVDGPSRLDVLDATGAVVAVLVDAVLTPGTYSVVWDAQGFGSGLYIGRLTSSFGSKTIQMVLLK